MQESCPPQRIPKRRCTVQRVDVQGHDGLPAARVGWPLLLLQAPAGDGDVMQGCWRRAIEAIPVVVANG